MTSSGPTYSFDDDVTLKYYRLQKISEGSIVLEPGEGGELKGPTAVGTGRFHDEQIELSRLIDILNDRFGTDFAPADQLFFDQIREEAVADDTLRQAANANTIENPKRPGLTGRTYHFVEYEECIKNENTCRSTLRYRGPFCTWRPVTRLTSRSVRRPERLTTACLAIARTPHVMC